MEDEIASFGRTEISFLKSQAMVNQRRRARICFHKTAHDPLNEMLIALSEKSYIRPHKHLNKSESFHIVEGLVDVVIFGDTGEILSIIELGDNRTERLSYYRLPKGIFHTILILSEMLVVHEVTSGPFLRHETVYANFSPDEAFEPEIVAYQKQLVIQVTQFKKSSKLIS